MAPLQSEEASFIAGLVAKALGFFATFVGGIVTATWVVAGKVKGFDDRLRQVEVLQNNCQGKTLVRIDEKLDRIHERIDEVLLKGKE